MNIVMLLLFNFIVTLTIERIVATESAVVSQVLKCNYYSSMVWISCTEVPNL